MFTYIKKSNYQKIQNFDFEPFQKKILEFFFEILFSKKCALAFSDSVPKISPNYKKNLLKIQNYVFFHFKVDFRNRNINKLNPKLPQEITSDCSTTPQKKISQISQSTWIYERANFCTPFLVVFCTFLIFQLINVKFQSLTLLLIFNFLFDAMPNSKKNFGLKNYYFFPSIYV